MNPNPKCSLCDSTGDETIQFSCGHEFCFKCFPYLLVNKLKSNGLDLNFFQYASSEYSCLLCPKAKTSKFDFSKIMQILSQISIEIHSNKEKEKIKKEICTRCRAFADTYCLDCKLFFCEACLELKHMQNSDLQWENHKICPYDIVEILEIDKNNNGKIYHCACSQSNNLEFFCFNCENSSCKKCVENFHKNHRFTPLEKMSLNYGAIKECLNQIVDKFEEHRKKLFSKLEEDVENRRKYMEQTCGEIIAMVTDLKNKEIERFQTEVNLLKNRFSLILTSLQVFKFDLEKSHDISSGCFQPSKFLQLRKLFPDLLTQYNHSFERFDINLLENSRIIWLKKQLLIESDKNNDEIFKFSGKSPTLSLNIPIVSYSQPIEIVKRSFSSMASLEKEIDIAFKGMRIDPIAFKPQKEELGAKRKTDNSFNFLVNQNKSECVTSFMLGEETFVVWPGLCVLQIEDKAVGFSILKVYNLSTGRMVHQFNGGTENAFITLVSMYPKYANYDCKKWLYTGDDEGILRVYNLKRFKDSNEFNKKEYRTKPPKPNTSLLSAVIFDDIFNEVASYTGTYALASFNDKDLGIYLYEFREKLEPEERKIISNDFNKICCLINFCQNDEKTWVFFGFTGKGVTMFDLRTSTFVREFEFEAETKIPCINFLTKINKNNGEKETFLVYPQNNNKPTNNENQIVLVNLETWHTQKIEGLEKINDICIWNSDSYSTQMLVAKDDGHPFSVIDHQNFVKAIQIKDDWKTFNILKVLRKDRGKFIEGIVVFQLRCDAKSNTQDRVLFFKS